MSLRSLLRPAPKLRAARSARPLQLEALESRLCMAGVPALSSLPGAAHTIYLDFDGHTVQGTEWSKYYNQSSLTAKPFDIDGNPSTFSAAEIARIEEAWQRVSEDFIPFNVNVTTVDPGVEALRKTSASDTRWGVRIIVTNESTMVTSAAKRTGAGGIAYVDSFNWNSDTPAWVFTTGAKSIAEAASHEAGHTLGLEHDGTASSGYYTGHGSGETGWAPIMGVGYSQNVTQWDNGTYSGTNNGGSDANFGAGADDIAVILAHNGFGYRADDHGNSSSSATTLTLNGTSASDSGIIERSTDVDVFSFTTGGGNVSLNIKPFAVGANLDVKVDLYNAAGVKVASSAPATTLDASLSLSLAAGTYYLHVDGAGSANYSDYGSIGRYTISGTIANSATPTSTAPASSSPKFSISDIVVNEAAGTATIDVTLTGNITAPASVVYATASGTAIAGKDFVSKTAKLTFKPGGATVARITVKLINDTVIEANEQFFVNLSRATGATIADAQGVVTIVDNDAPVVPSSLAINSWGVTSGSTASTQRLWFEVTLDKPSTKQVTVRYTTADGLAKVAAGDYRSTSGTLTFAAGQTTKYIPVTVYRSTVATGSKPFLMLLSHATGATVEASYAMSTLNIHTASAASHASPEPVVDPMHYFEDGGSHAHHTHGDVADATARGTCGYHDTHALCTCCAAANHSHQQAATAPDSTALKSRVITAVLREVQTSSSERNPAAVDLVMRRLEDLFGEIDGASI